MNDVLDKVIQFCESLKTNEVRDWVSITVFDQDDSVVHSSRIHALRSKTKDGDLVWTFDGPLYLEFKPVRDGRVAKAIMTADSFHALPFSMTARLREVEGVMLFRGVPVTLILPTTLLTVN